MRLSLLLLRRRVELAAVAPERTPTARGTSGMSPNTHACCPPRHSADVGWSHCSGMHLHFAVRFSAAANQLQ